MTNKNLIIWYKGNEIGLNNQVEDASGNDNHGILQGAINIKEDEKEQSLFFDAEAESHILLPTDALAGCDHLTISSWVKPTTLDAWARLFDFGDDQAKNFFFAVNSNVANSNGGRPIVSLTNGNLHQVHSRTDLVSGKWQHIAVTIEDQVATIYINGIETGKNDQINMAPSIYLDGNNYIGKSHFEVDPYYNGALQDFRVYSEALSVAEIRQTMLERMSDEEAVNVVVGALEIVGREMIKEDILMPESFLPGVALEWSSNNEEIGRAHV